jgi:hypothetical protein
LFLSHELNAEMQFIYPLCRAPLQGPMPQGSDEQLEGSA